MHSCWHVAVAYLFIYLFTICTPTAHAQYNANVYLLVEEAFGSRYELAPGEIGFHASPSVTVEDVAFFNQPDYAAKLQSLDSPTRKTRLIYYLQKKANELGIDDSEIERVTLVGGKIPMISLPEQYAPEMIEAARKDGVQLKLDPEMKIIENRRVIGADVLPAIEANEAAARSVVDLALQTVLPDKSADIFDKSYLANLELQSLQKTANEYFRHPPGLPLAPERMRSEYDNSYNLAVLNPAENSAWETAGTIAYEVEKIASRLIDLQSSLEDKLEHSIQMGELLRLIAGDSASDSDRKRLNRMVSVFANTLGQFKFDARHSMRQYHRLHYAPLIPLYSFGLVHALNKIRNVEGFREEFFGTEKFDLVLFAIVRTYVKELQSLDSVTIQALVKIARLQYAHPLIQLSAYHLLERHLGGWQARELTLIEDKDLRALYENAAFRVVLSPTFKSVVLRPQLDLASNIVLDLNDLWQSLEPLRKRLDLPYPQFPTRFTHNNPGMKGWGDEEHARHQKVLKAIREFREKSQQATPPPAPDIKISFPNRYPIVTRLSADFNLVQKDPSNLAVVAMHLDEEVIETLPLADLSFKVEKDPRSAGFAIDYPILRKRYLYGFSANRRPMIRQISTRTMSESECEKILKH